MGSIIETVFLCVLALIWFNVVIFFRTGRIFGKKIRKKALTKIGIYTLILSFLVFYQIYFFGQIRIILAQTVGTTTTSTSSTTSSSTSTTSSSSTTTSSTTSTTITTTTTIPLQPATVEFSVSAIYMPRGEINVTGNTTHLNTYWEAYYSDGSQRDIGAVCFLNCDERYNTTCPAPYNCSCPAVQNCSVLTPPGKGVCSMAQPNYNTPYNRTDFVGCRLYDPMYPDMVMGHLNTTFVPIDLSVWFSEFSSIVGEEFNFPVNIKNQGLFTDTFKVESWTNKPDIIKINPQTQTFSVQLHGDSFEPHIWQNLGPEIKQVYIKVVLLDASETQTNLCVNVTSSIEPVVQRPEDHCKELKSQFRSLPEINSISLILLMLIASAFIFKFKKDF